MTLVVNGVQQESVFVNGIKMETIYMNETMVSEGAVSITVPSNVSSYNMRSAIDALGLSTKQYNFVNNGIIGSLISGDLTGYNVDFINNGEIQGIRNETRGVGGDAVTLTSPLSFTNKGWLRGAGGAGGKGAKGADDTYMNNGVETTRIGGEGGLGGLGRGYDKGLTAGSVGNPSTPAGGNSGGYGGSGGSWGIDGVRPSGGELGTAAGKAIVGSSFITNLTWNYGSVDGIIA